MRGMTYRHLCDDWVLKAELRHQGKKTPYFFKEVQRREKELASNPNSFSCFGSSQAECRSHCYLWELCEEIRFGINIENAIVILEEYDEDQ